MVITTLCGSTKFKKQFKEVEAALTFKGHIVLSLGFFEHSEGIILSSNKLKMLEMMHYQKIELSDEIYVIDIEGYIGSSTQKEIQYAKDTGKMIRYHSEWKEELLAELPW
ncbi:DUF4406 domain-containing protein [Alkalihalobacillus pseudalcaliphilus]|uniref:DUF4406 domain-containing protein n=1 Tax=Alkalihalobacillus pseudalcaliphilus TaxID=79884 RepID=UPI00064DCABA|nr:DUF4406 domain-containing protein [Alkalihalobacillus pseudalcaliphilus]KMK75244.1 hypothetical protein AB990_17600 [Alkalihalobacillus pseudalcaliphilus]